MRHSVTQHTQHTAKNYKTKTGALLGRPAHTSKGGARLQSLDALPVWDCCKRMMMSNDASTVPARAKKASVRRRVQQASASAKWQRHQVQHCTQSTMRWNELCRCGVGGRRAATWGKLGAAEGCAMERTAPRDRATTCSAPSKKWLKQPLRPTLLKHNGYRQVLFHR